MSFVFLLAGVVSLLFVLRGRVETAFLYVYLPCLLLFPNGFGFRLPHLPPLSAAQAALIPIGIVALYRLISSRSFRPMDGLVLLFLVSATLSEVLREPVVNDGIFISIGTFISLFMTYAVGRTLIEPHLRIASVRNIVIMVLLLGPVGLIEWRLGMNLYGIINERLFGGTLEVYSTVQMRSGHGRMGASFVDAEIGGIAFGMTAVLNTWLVFLNKRHPMVPLGRFLSRLEKWHIPGMCLILFVYLTQSRGPLMTTIVAYLIVQIPKFKKVKLASVIVALIILSGGIAAYSYFSHYTNNVDFGSVANEQQGSALYRRLMNERYKPIAEAGGWLGWGLLHHPSIPGLLSIDNEFLLIHLSQGRLGYLLFILICLESFRKLCLQAWNIPDRIDKAFAFSIFASMFVFWITLLTVYMGEQLPQFGFLLLGWGQSITPAGLSAESAAPEQQVRQKYVFKRVYS